MEPFNGIVRKFVDGKPYVETEHGNFLLHPSGCHRVYRRTARAKQTSLETPRHLYYSKALSAPQVVIGDEVTILQTAGRHHNNGDRLAKKWTPTVDFTRSINWLNEGQESLHDAVVLVASLYEELLAMVPDPGRRAPTFIYVPPSELLKRANLRPAYFGVPESSNEDLTRFAVLNALRVDLSEKEFVVEGTPHGSVELVTVSEGRMSQPASIFGILPADSTDIIAWDPFIREWESVRFVKVAISSPQDTVVVVCLQRPNQELVRSRFGIRYFRFVRTNWLIVGDATSRRFQQDLKSMPPVKRRV